MKAQSTGAGALKQLAPGNGELNLSGRSSCR